MSSRAERRPAADGLTGTTEVEKLRARLDEADETLRAIRSGEIDAVIVHAAEGDRVFTLRGAEQPYRTLVEQMREGAAILTTDGHVLYCNRRFAELVALPLQEVIGGPVDRFIGDSDREAFAALVAAGSGAYQGCLNARSGRSPEVYVSLTTTVSDGVERRNLIVADLSELVDARAERERAESENRTKDEFLAMLAHELRNPLGAIAGAVQVLETVGRQDDPSLRARAVIVRQVGHLARLIDDLLDVGRLATGKITLTRQPVDLADLVHRSIAVRSSDRRLDKRVEVTTEPVWIDADPVRIEQVITNLLGNAVKYTLDGGRIRVSVSADGDSAVFRVEDNGMGIAPDLLPRIFDLFVQGQQTLDRSRGGLGIGLTLARRLVELHGGTLRAASDGPGRGSVFTVRLQAIPAPEKTAADPSPDGQTKRRRVLIIEDNADSREMYRKVLELEGHEVLEAADAARGLELLKCEQPEIAFIDIGLPGLNGYEVARRFRAEAGVRKVMLVALTGYGSLTDRERSREAGFDHHLVKPVSREMLRTLLGGSHG
jgi:signal transduction histidine kinase